MTGRGSIRHNNRSFSAANVDRSRSEQNITFCNDDLKQVYHELFDEALAAYNAKKKKTRDKIPDYYEHIRQSKQAVSYTHLDVYKRQANRRSYFTRPSSRSVTWRLSLIHI